MPFKMVGVLFLSLSLSGFGGGDDGDNYDILTTECKMPEVGNHITYKTQKFEVHFISGCN